MIGDRARRLLEFALDRIDKAVAPDCNDVARTLTDAREALAALQELDGALALDAPADLTSIDGSVKALEHDLAAVSHEERLVAEAATERTERRARARLAVDEDERLELDRLQRDRARAQVDHERRREEWEQAHAAEWTRLDEHLREREHDIRGRGARLRAELEKEDETDRNALRAQLDRVRRDKAWVADRLTEKRATP